MQEMILGLAQQALPYIITAAIGLFLKKYLDKIVEVLEELSKLFDTMAKALEDGKITKDEMKDIMDDALAIVDDEDD